MKKKILILSAGSTGGHHSASTAIKKSLISLDEEIIVNEYDSNKLFLGYKGSGGEQGYITMTTRLRFLWKIFFELTSFIKPISNFFLNKAIKKKLNILLKEEKFDAIISLHPCFVGSVLKSLKKFDKIPFYVVCLDPIKQSSLWIDKRTDLNFLPTSMTESVFLKKGIDKNKIIVSGFPVSCFPKITRKENKRKKLLFVNPSQKGLKASKRLIEAAFSFDVDIDVITGSDHNLYNYLNQHLPKREGLKIYEYVYDLSKRMQEADILLTKAGPNVIFEAISLNVPLIITGHLLGQEEKNHLYVTSNGYGFVAENKKTLHSLLNKLLIDEPTLLDKIRDNQRNCKDVDGAKTIAKKVIELFKDNS